MNIKKDTASGRSTFVAYDKKTGAVVSRGTKKEVSSFCERTNNHARTGRQRPDLPPDARLE